MEQEDCLPIAVSIPERSFYLTNLSKTLAPGLRIGFLALPHSVKAAVERAMAATIWVNPPLMAEIGSRWIDDGTADRAILQKRRAAESRMAILAGKLAGQQLQFRPGSLHAWLKLPAPWTGETFARQAASRGVQVIPSANFCSTREQPGEEAVRICIGPPKDEAEVERGGEILASILAGLPVPLQPFM